MKFKLFINYLKLKDFLSYEPILVKASFGSQDDIEIFVGTNEVFMKKQIDGIIIKRKHWYEKLMFWKGDIR